MYILEENVKSVEIVPVFPYHPSESLPIGGATETDF